MVGDALLLEGAYFQVAESQVNLQLLLRHESDVDVSYFQVAESQVIAVSMWLIESFRLEIGLLPGCGIPGHQGPPGGLQRSNQLRFPSYFQVALSQVMCVVSMWRRSASKVLGDRVTSRLRNPRSSVVLSRSAASYFQVADSNAMPSQVMGFSLSGWSHVRLAGSGFLRVRRQELQGLEGFAGVPGHLGPPGTCSVRRVARIYPKSSRVSQVMLSPLD